MSLPPRVEMAGNDVDSRIFIQACRGLLEHMTKEQMQRRELIAVEQVKAHIDQKVRLEAERKLISDSYRV